MTQTLEREMMVAMLDNFADCYQFWCVRSPHTAKRMKGCMNQIKAAIKKGRMDGTLPHICKALGLGDSPLAQAMR